MLKNYFKIAFRNLMRYKIFSLINILGLALGMTCSILILLWVQDERSIDNFHENKDRLFVVYQRQFIDNKIEAGYFTPGLLGNEIKRVIPEIQYASGFAWVDNATDRLTFQAGDKIIKFDGCYADSDYFKMASYSLLKGNKTTSLNSPVSLCISEKMAKAFFGSSGAAIGKTLRYENKKDLTITGVFADVKNNSSVRYDFLINWFTFLDDNSWAKDWGNNGPNVLVLLRKNADPQLVDKKIRKFLDKYNKDQTASFHVELGLQKLS